MESELLEKLRVAIDDLKYRIREHSKREHLLCSEIAAIKEAIEDGGFVMLPCSGCGRPVVCLDSGEGALCVECAKGDR